MSYVKNGGRAIGILRGTFWKFFIILKFGRPFLVFNVSIWIERNAFTFVGSEVLVVKLKHSIIGRHP